MNRLRRVFELTVAEQRVVVTVLLLLVMIVAYRTYRIRAKTTVPPAVTQSPSPGTRP